MAQAQITMAAMPSTSAGSSGGDGQPPKKQSRMDIKAVLPSDSDNSSEEDDSDPASRLASLHSLQSGCVSSVKNIQMDCLKCPICHEYPRKEVYQCINGHSVCSGCTAKLTRCPSCRAIYTKKIRNLAVEELLDTLTFNCSYMDGVKGCLKAKIPRNRRTAHEIQCEHNPSPTIVKFCEPFDSPEQRFSPGTCQFRICSNSIIEDPQHIKDVIEHLTSHPHNLPYQKVKIGDQIRIQFRLPTNSEKTHFAPFKLFEVTNGGAGDTIGYYVLILLLHQKIFSWTVVGFTSSPEDQNASETSRNRKITAKFFIQAKPEPGSVERYGDGCVSNLSWTIKTTHLNEWKEYIAIPQRNRPMFSFLLPVSLLRYYYTLGEDRCEMTVSFGLN